MAMKFTSIASSSRGNAYILEFGDAQPLLLEAGLPVRELRNKLREHDKMLTGLAGCLISHEHL